MNLDALQRFPNQLIDGDPTECVGLTISDIVGNILNTPCDPDYSYAMALRFAGEAPTTAGSDPLAGMAGAIWYGVLPETIDTFDAKDKGELYVANWQNYSPEQIQGALKVNGLRFLPSYSAIVDHLKTYGTGVSLPMWWYTNFSSATSLLPTPDGTRSAHNVAVYDVSDKGLLVKPWLGKDYAQGGYVWLPEAVYNQVGFTAYGFDLNANRLLTLILLEIISLQYMVNYLSRNPRP